MQFLQYNFNRNMFLLQLKLVIIMKELFPLLIHQNSKIANYWKKDEFVTY